MTVQGSALGLSLWFAAVNVAVLVTSLLHVPVPEPLTVVTVLVVYSYAMLPVRWMLTLMLLVRTVSAKPLRLLPRARPVQIAFVIVVQILLGFLSFIGWWELWDESARPGDHVLGFIVHVCMPLALVLWLRRRARRVDRIATAPPAPQATE